MLKALLGALAGALLVSLAVSVTGLVLDWLEFDRTLLVVAGVSALAGAVVGFLRPKPFVGLVFFFLEPSLLD